MREKKNLIDSSEVNKIGILAKKIYRDLIKNKGRSFSIIAIIAVSTGLYGGLLLTHINALNTFDTMEKNTSLESVRFSLNDFVNIENLTLDGIQNIKKWDYRLSLLTSLRLENDSDNIFTAPIYGIPDTDFPKVNSFLLEDGKFIDKNKDSQIMIITQFIQNNDLVIGDTVWIDTPFGREELKITAEILSPEYIYNVNPISGLPDFSGLSSSWIAIDEVREYFGLPIDTVNELLFLFDEGLTDDNTLVLINQIKTQIKEIAPFVTYTLVEDEGEQMMKDADVGALDDFARVFGIIILLLALFIMYDNISKLIASQRNYIGTMRALGGHKKVVMMHYTWMSIVLSVIGVLLGIPFGKYIGDTMVVEYSNVLGIPSPTTDFYLQPFIESIAINFSLAVIVSILSSMSAAKIEPREAMASAFVTMVFKAKPILEIITSRIPGLNTPSMTIPLRSVFRQRRKTILTVFTYAVSMLLVISALGFMDSFTNAIDNNYNEIQTYDMEAHFITPILPSEISNVLLNIIDISKIEFFSTTMTEITVNNYNKSVLVQALPENITMRNFNIVEGTDKGLVLGSIIANDLNVTTNDKIEMFNRTFSISGITSELLAETVFLKLETLQDIMETGNNVTSVFIKGIDGVDLKELKHKVIDSDLPIAIVIVNDEVKASINIMIQGLMALIGVMVMIGFGTVLLFSFNTIVLDVITREMEFINIRTLGGGKKKVFKVIATQAIIISFLGSLLAIPLSYYSTVWIMNEMIGDLMVLPIFIKPETYMTGIFSAIIASAFGIFAAYKKIMKIDLADAMRTRMAN